MFEIRETTKADSLGLIQLWRATWTATYGPSLGADVLTRMLANLDENGITSMLPEKESAASALRQTIAFWAAPSSWNAAV